MPKLNKVSRKQSDFLLRTMKLFSKLILELNEIPKRQPRQYFPKNNPSQSCTRINREYFNPQNDMLCRKMRGYKSPQYLPPGADPITLFTCEDSIKLST